MMILVYGLLITALILFLLPFLGVGARQNLWIGAVVAAVLAILIYLFFGGGVR